MFYQRLIYTEDYAGSTGLLLKGHNEDAYIDAATDGRLIAHDILEHQNGAASIGTPWDEFEALGGVYYVRAQHTPMQLHYDVMSVVEDIESYDLPWQAAPRTKECDADEDFLAIIKEAAEDREFNHKDVLSYLRIGYRKAEKRFERPHWAYDLFMNIEKAVNDFDLDEYYLGQEFLLSYNHSKAEMRMI